MRDTWTNFRDIGDTMLSEFGDNYNIYFWDMGHFLEKKKINGYGILGAPFQGLTIQNIVTRFAQITLY